MGFTKYKIHLKILWEDWVRVTIFFFQTLIKAVCLEYWTILNLL